MNSEIRYKLAAIIDKTTFLFFIVLVFFLPISNSAVESSIGFILFCLFLKGLIVRPSGADLIRFFKDRINLSLLVFFIAIGLSLFASGHLLIKSFKAWICKWAEAIALFYCIRIFLKKEKISVLLFIFLASGFLVSLDGVYQKLTGVDFIRGYTIGKLANFNLFAVTASFKHYNDFAAYLITLLFVSLGLSSPAKKILLNIFLFLFAAFIMSVLVFTYSRGAWIAFWVVNLFLIIFFPAQKVKVVSMTFLVIFIIGIINLPSIKKRLLFILAEGGDNTRLSVWKAALLMFKDSPIFGKGLGLFMDYLHKYTEALSGQYAHNCYLQILAETGLLGLLSFLWFLGEIVFRAYRKLTKSFDRLLAGLFFGFSAYLVHAFFDTHLFSLRLSILFWILSGLMAVIISEKNEQPSI